MPDRIVPSLDTLNDLLTKEQRLRRAEIHEREKFRRQQGWKNLMGAVLLVCVAALAVWNWQDRLATERDQERSSVERQCAAWQNRVEDHATLTSYLAEFVGASERGNEFVTGLRSAYAKSDRDYARERGLTEERCS